MIRKCFVVLLLVLVDFPFNSISQQILTQYSIQDGLPSSEVYDVFEAKTGHIFFLTDKGISKYNGYEFINYTTLNGLSENIYFNSFKLKNSDFLIYGMDNHVDYVSTSDSKFYPYPFNDTIIKYAPDIITNFYFSDGNHLLISYNNHADYLEIDEKGNVLSKPKKLIPGDILKYYAHPNISGFNFIGKSGNKDIHSFSEEFQHNNTYKPTYHSSGGNKIYSTSPYKLHLATPSDSTSLSLESAFVEFGTINDNLFWYSQYKKGVHIINKDGRELYYFLNGVSVSEVFEDSNRFIWITTLNNGVFVLPIYADQISVADQSTAHIRSIVSDNKGRLFVSLENGAICIKKDRSLKTFYKSANGRHAILTFSTFHQAVLAFIDNEIMNLGSNEKYPTTFTGNPNKFTQTEDNRLCISGYFGFAYRYKNERFQKAIDQKNVTDHCFYNDKIFLSTRSGLYHSVDSSYLKFELFDLVPERINCLMQVKEYLLCGTNGQGIIILKNDKIVGNIHPNLIGSGFINVFEYNENTNELWVGTNLGLTLININQSKLNESTVQNLANLLPNREITTLHILNDTTWVGTKNGLFMIDRKILTKEQPVQNYHLRIRKMVINDDVITYREPLELSHTENRIEIKYNAISLHPGQDLSYRYRLKGTKQNWTYSQKRSAQYPNLSPGAYTFEVEVADDNGQYGAESVQIQFIINPPFWKTWWFRSSFIAIITLIIYLFFRFRILLYNRDIVREILRQIMKKLKKQTLYITVKESGSEVKILTGDILFVKSDGNYLEIHTEKGKHVIREKIGNFLDLVPDPLEFLRVRRSYIVRIDKVTQKGKKHLMINEHIIDVGETYLKALDNIHL